MTSNTEGFNRIICIDFDGVIHWYRQGWKNGEIYDAPVPGALQWIRDLVDADGFSPVIYSSRSKFHSGIEAMKSWLCTHGLEDSYVQALEFPVQKPPAWITVDDRCFRFYGAFPDLSYLSRYKTWTSPEAPPMPRDVVRRFAEDMEHKLRENAHKGGWEQDSFESLFKRLEEETKEARKAVHALTSTLWDDRPGDPVERLDALGEAAIYELADVANFAMMLADRIRSRLVLAEDVRKAQAEREEARNE